MQEKEVIFYFINDKALTHHEAVDLTNLIMAGYNPN